MNRGRRMPRQSRTRSASQGAAGGWAGLAPVIGLCLVALIGAVVAFSGRGGAEARSNPACLADSAPGQFKSWDAFFRRYPFDDAFLKARIRDANGEAPGETVLVPLSVEASCGRRD